MKRETLEKRLFPLYTKEGRLAKRYSSVCHLFEYLQKGEKIHPFYWMISLKHKSLYGENVFSSMCRILECLRVKYIVANDAPRGGKEGDFIQIQESDLRKFRGMVPGLLEICKNA